MNILIIVTGHPDFQYLSKQIEEIKKYGNCTVCVGTINCISEKIANAGNYKTSYKRNILEPKLNFNFPIEFSYIDNINNYNLDEFVPWMHQWELFDKIINTIKPKINNFDYIIRTRPDNIICSSLTFNENIQVSFRHEPRLEIKKIVASDQFIIMPKNKILLNFSSYYNSFKKNILYENSIGRHSLELISEVKLAEYMNLFKYTWEQDNIKVYPASWIRREPNSLYAKDIEDFK